MTFASAAGNLGTAIGLAGEVNSLITTGDFSFRDATNADILARLDALSSQIDEGFEDLTEVIYRSDLNAAVNEAQTVFTQLRRVNDGTLTLDSNGELALSNQAIDAYVAVYDQVVAMIALSNTRSEDALPADFMATVYTAATFVMTLQLQYSATLDDGAIGEAVLSDQLIDMANAIAYSEITLRRTLEVNIEVKVLDGVYWIGERSSRYDGASDAVINTAIATVLASGVFTPEALFGEANFPGFSQEIITDWGGLLPTNQVYSEAIAELIADQPDGPFFDFGFDHRNWMAQMMSVLVTEEVMRATGVLDRSRELELQANEWAFLSNGVQIVDPDGAGGNEIVGSAYFDFLIGNDGDDSMYGGDNADVIYGGGNDPLKYDLATYGNDGDDYVFAGGGTDLVRGGTGNDHLVGGGSNDTLYGGAGDDLLWGSSGFNTFAGMLGLDSLLGGTGNDTIWLDDPFQSLGQTGHGDTALGGAGNDTIYGSVNDDSIVGGNDADLLYGERGRDFLDGGDGADDLRGGLGNDTLLGGKGNDSLFGDADDIYNDSQIANYSATGDGDESDLLEGGDGDDLLVGEQGNDTLNGDGGADSLFGGDGDDSLSGGADDDVLVGNADNDTLKGEGGKDSLFGETGDDQLFGGDGDDELYGQDGADTMVGGLGDDLLVGGIGDDSMTGFDGDDSLYSEAGADTLSGGLGADSMEGGDGNDSMLGEDGADSLFGGDGVDTIRGGDGDDFLYGDFEEYDLPIGAGDSMEGGAGDDYLDAGAGADTLEGGIGDDTLLGREGADSLTGGDGFDLLLGFEAADTLDGGAGNDSMRGGLGDDTLSGGDGDDTLKGDDSFSLDGAGGADSIDGGAGNDVLEGGYGDDILNGGADDDTLDGGHGTDTLNGDAGNDRFLIAGSDGAMFGGQIDGGEGTDTLDLRELGLAYAIDVQDTAADGGQSGSIAVTSAEGPVYTVQFSSIEGILEAGDVDPGGDFPVAASDFDTVDVNGATTASGNVLANDTDPYTPGGPVLAVTGARAGDEAEGGGLDPVTTSVSILGIHGTLVIAADGGYTYTVDTADPDTLAIAYSEYDRFIYAATDADGLSDLTTLTINVERNEDEEPPVSFGGAAEVPLPLVVGPVAAEPEMAPVTPATPPEAETQPVDIPAAVLNVLPTGDVTIAGTATEGETLTALSTLSDEDGLGDLSYQWLRDGTPIGGATSSTHVLTAADVGAALSVVVSYTDDLGTDEEVQSAPTAAVAVIPEVAPEPIVGTDGADTLTGTDGDDTIAGQGGDDAINAGGGADNIAGSDGADTIDGGSGNDNIGGGTGNDVIDGGAGQDTIGAGQGDDTADGGDGNDIVNGGGGNDSLSGGLGDDTAGASFGNDTVNGGDGNDSLGGGTGKDLLTGGAGADSIGGGEGDDTVFGSGGNDFLAGGGRNDLIDGGGGNDTINGGDGDDTMTGGAGADAFVFNFFKDGDADVITDFQDGIDSFRMVGVENAPGSGLAGKVTALNITDVAGGAQIDYQGHTVLIEGVAAADLTVDDFTFL